MKFEQALEMVRLGKLVRRQEWTKSSSMALVDGYLTTINASVGTQPVVSINACHLLAEDWEVVEPPKSLEEVLPAFREGKKIRRRSWDADSWISPLVAIGAYVAITINDMKANDWEILDD